MTQSTWPTKGTVTPATRERATELYFEIEKHLLTTRTPLGYRQVGRMLGAKSTDTGSVQHYLKILRRWGLITWEPGMALSITLVKRENYPPVEWRKME